MITVAFMSNTEAGLAFLGMLIAIGVITGILMALCLVASVFGFAYDNPIKILFGIATAVIAFLTWRKFKKKKKQVSKFMKDTNIYESDIDNPFRKSKRIKRVNKFLNKGEDYEEPDEEPDCVVDCNNRV